MKVPKEIYDTILLDFGNAEIPKKLAELPYRQYLKTKYWAELRKVFRKTIGNKCEVCNTKSPLNIHHFNYANIGKETFNDIVCLCETCHRHIHVHQDQLFHTVDDRRKFDKLMRDAEKIKSKFTNDRYLKLLLLTRKPFWNAAQLSELWHEDVNSVTKYLELEVKTKLITDVVFNNDTYPHYVLKHFIWYLIEFDYPKL